MPVIWKHGNKIEVHDGLETVDGVSSDSFVVFETSDGVRLMVQFDRDDPGSLHISKLFGGKKHGMDCISVIPQACNTIRVR